ncbi:hypothetical protein [Leeuwenhoekiella aequorea]|uniref:C1q domain-containing protein n=1 Tax=Leeuwenhoekiella aequorea TaxID=283736 RepID=A0A4V1KRC8_9FLAO|nr:hypothetical protein [Leeuwenhoekiella aequorea]RXG24462.1 hypothetical protein DSM00_250 [Leeuwenhoekiella aequorea]
MKNSFLFVCLVLLFNHTVAAQVAIGTTNPDDGSALQIDSTVGALVPPRMTDAQMRAISSPLDGSIVYNKDISSLFLFSSGNWNDLDRNDLPSLVLRKVFTDTTNTVVQTQTNTYAKFPLNSGDIENQDKLYFNIVSDGTFKILQGGNYMISAGFSVTNLPSGDKKYIIGVYRNNTLVGYLVRGNVNFPSGTNEWGTSGVLVFKLNAGDVLDLRYVLNNNGNKLAAKFFNIGVIKL